jgi:hypothetical protein
MSRNATYQIIRNFPIAIYMKCINLSSFKFSENHGVTPGRKRLNHSLQMEFWLSGSKTRLVLEPVMALLPKNCAAQISRSSNQSMQ